MSPCHLRRAFLASLALAGAGSANGQSKAGEPACPGTLVPRGIGNVSLVPSGWGVAEEVPQVWLEEDTITAPMGSRSYFAAYCTAGEYNASQYQAWDLRGKTLVYTTDLSQASCGCNAAFYLTSMAQNEDPSDCGDHYCDANNVCGRSCAEIDIQEGNRYAWHSTLHASADHGGLGRGYGGGGLGWSGPRDWGAEEFGPGGKCVDTKLPFEVSVYFPVDDAGSLKAMEITLTQHGKHCPLWTSIGGYTRMAELDAAMAAGMTPIVSYWSSDEMVWMDGKGADGQGPCEKETPDRCGEYAMFYNFSVTPAFPPTEPPSTTSMSPSSPALAPRRSGHAGISARAFLFGAFSMLAAQIMLVLLVWAIRSATTRRGQPVCPQASAAVSPLARAVAGSSQSLLALAGATREASQASEISLP